MLNARVHEQWTKNRQRKFHVAPPNYLDNDIFYLHNDFSPMPRDSQSFLPFFRVILYPSRTCFVKKIRWKRRRGIITVRCFFYNSLRQSVGQAGNLPGVRASDICKVEVCAMCSLSTSGPKFTAAAAPKSHLADANLNKQQQAARGAVSNCV